MNKRTKILFLFLLIGLLFSAQQTFAQVEASNYRSSTLTIGNTFNSVTQFSAMANPYIPIPDDKIDTTADTKDATSDVSAEQTPESMDENAMNERRDDLLTELDSDSSSDAMTDSSNDSEQNSIAQTEDAVTPVEVIEPAKVEEKEERDTFSANLLNITVFYEFGKVDKIVDNFNNFTKNIGNNKSISYKVYKEIQTDFNSILDQMEEEGRINLSASASLFTPMSFYIPDWGGYFTFSHSFHLGGAIGFKKNNGLNESSKLPVGNPCRNLIETAELTEESTNVDPILAAACALDITNGGPSNAALGGENCATALQNGNTNGCDFNIYNFTADSVFTLSAFQVHAFEFGHSRQIMTLESTSLPWLTDGEIYVGGNLNFNFAKLGYEELGAGSGDTPNQAVDKAVEDGESSVVPDLNLAVGFRNRYYHAGLTIDHLLFPSYKYSGGKTVDMPLHFQTDVSLTDLFTENSHLNLSWVEDWNSDKSYSGTEYQWRVLSVDYNPHWFWVPGIRLGKRYLLNKGRELSYNQFGLTLLGFIHADVALSDQELSTNDGSIWASAIASVNFGTAF